MEAYTPPIAQSHNLTLHLSNQITQHAKELETVFPQNTKLSRRTFQLLKKAYIEARYSDKYEITVEELQWLAERVEILKTLTEQLCTEHIKQL